MTNNNIINYLKNKELRDWHSFLCDTIFDVEKNVYNALCSRNYQYYVVLKERHLGHFSYPQLPLMYGEKEIPVVFYELNYVLFEDIEDEKTGYRPNDVCFDFSIKLISEHEREITGSIISEYPEDIDDIICKDLTTDIKLKIVEMEKKMPDVVVNFITTYLKNSNISI